ncbi:MAG: hypothetical protein INQ03_08690 [Candidatus Heimdallarchaeota archaeon]|nr:hypothetical protein [Candidatus Heimdallarchaeota archaeon]
MLKKILRSRRALSPVLSAVFLMALFIAAIGVAIGIIYPQVNELDDNINMINAGSALNSLDDEIKRLISSGEGSSITKNIEIGSTGVLIGDSSAFSTIYLNEYQNASGSTVTRGVYYVPHNRLIVSQEIKEDTLQQYSHQYLEGTGSQNIFFLNNSYQGIYPWVILNQSRGYDYQVNTSLSYRGLMSTEKEILDLSLEMVITIQLIVLDFPLNTIKSGHYQGVTLEYHTLNSTTTSATAINGDNNYFIMRIETELPGSANRIEIPLTHEVPENSQPDLEGKINVYLRFITHHISIKF